MPIINELMHRHQFDRSDTQPLEMLDRRIRSKPSIGPAQMRGYLLIALREALYV